MKKTYITPAIASISAQTSAILAGSINDTDTRPSFGLGNQEDENKGQWEQNGTIGEYTGDGDDIIISAKGFSGDWDSDWDLDW